MLFFGDETQGINLIRYPHFNEVGRHAQAYDFTIAT